MSTARRLALSALCAALSTAALLLGGWLRTYALGFGALAGIFPAFSVLLCGYGWGVGAFAAGGLLGLLLSADKAAVIWFFLFFGHYPIWKSLLEQLRSPILRWGGKLIGFGLCMGLVVWLFRAAFLDAVPWAEDAPYWLLLLIGGAMAAAFLAYDYAFSLWISFFQRRIRPYIK